MQALPLGPLGEEPSVSSAPGGLGPQELLGLPPWTLAASVFTWPSFLCLSWYLFSFLKDTSHIALKAHPTPVGPHLN